MSFDPEALDGRNAEPDPADSKSLITGSEIAANRAHVTWTTGSLQHRGVAIAFASSLTIRQRVGQTQNAEATLAPAFGVNQTVAGFRRPIFSSPGRTRTYDPAVNSRLLYQLSYRGK